MNMPLLLIGRATGLMGALLTVVAVMLRLSGTYSVGGFQVVTLLFAGGVGMILGCLCLLMVLTSRSPR